MGGLSLIDLFKWPTRAFHLLPPEKAHQLTVKALSHVPGPPCAPTFDTMLGQEFWGLKFPNPVGIAAGFDKNAECFAPLFGFGFGSVEIGSVTPKPQLGNPSPRVFRLSKDLAVINRMGFPNHGLEVVAQRLAQRKFGAGIVGGNVGKNKETPDAIPDYVQGIKALGPLVDYLVVNISSPNTPGLRDLQKKEVLDELLAACLEARDQAGRKPLLLKIAPDLGETQLRDISDVAMARGIDGLIVSNTTLARPLSLTDPQAKEAGGLSGAPLMAPSTQILRHIYQMTKGTLPLVGVGGIMNAADAYAKIKAGASLLQLYTGMIYQGPGIAHSINTGLKTLLKQDGYSHLRQAIGQDAMGAP